MYIYIYILIYWLVVSGIFFLISHMGIIIPSDEVKFFRGVALKPPTKFIVLQECFCMLVWMEAS